jgi:hypothetical protein
MDILTREETLTLRWLARETNSQYGECHGPGLDGLRRGLPNCTLRPNLKPSQ